MSTLLLISTTFYYFVCIFQSRRLDHCDDNAGLKYTLSIIVCLDNVMLSSDVSGGDHNSCLSLVRIPWTRTLIGRCWPHTSDALETDWQVTVVTPSSRDETCIICTICCSHRRKEAQTEDASPPPLPSHRYIRPSVFLLTIFTQFLLGAAK